MTTPNFDFVPLDDYEYQHTEIATGEVIDLIAFSGGPADDEDNIYYYQFIGIRTSTGDTVKILSPLISVPGETEKERIHTTPLQFNADKNITYGTYRPMDSAHVILLEHDRLAKMGEGIVNADPGSFDKITQKQTVVLINEGWFRNRYPAAVGIIDFDGVVW